MNIVDDLSNLVNERVGGIHFASCQNGKCYYGSTSCSSDARLVEMYWSNGEYLDNRILCNKAIDRLQKGGWIVQ